MKKKITALCCVMVVLSICVAVFGATGTYENDTTTATMKNYYAPREETTEGDALGGISDILGGLGEASSDDMLGGIGSGTMDVFGDALSGIGGVVGGIGDALGGIAGGIGDSLGGIFGGLGGSGSGTVVNTTEPATTSADIGLIIPVPAATQAPAETQTTSAESTVSGETVDFAATSNPYTKPSAAFSAGDEDETIKWLQWIFIYTHYGLKDNGITGVLDEDTVAVVKKLQHENKLTVDGNINEDVIKAAEVLYYQSMLGEDMSAIELPSDATTSVSVSNPVDYSEGGDNSTVILLIIILVIIWVLAIGGIVLLFVFKKKKMNAMKKASAENSAAEETRTDKSEGKQTSEIKSLSDLFEEAENKDK